MSGTIGVGVVTETNPIRVRLEGSTTPMPVVSRNVSYTPAINDVVLAYVNPKGDVSIMHRCVPVAQ